MLYNLHSLFYILFVNVQIDIFLIPVTFANTHLDIKPDSKSYPFILDG